MYVFVAYVYMKFEDRQLSPKAIYMYMPSIPVWLLHYHGFLYIRSSLVTWKIVTGLPEGLFYNYMRLYNVRG